MTPPSSRPPRLARAILRATTHADDRGPLLGDLDERFGSIVQEHGLARARRWYWSQAFRGVPARMRGELDVARHGAWTGAGGEVRQTLRSLVRRPLYTVGVVGTLAIGLSSTAVVGSIAWNVWLAPMPFPDPDRVVRLFELEPPAETGGVEARATRWRLSPPLLEDLRAHEWTTVEAVGGVTRNVADWVHDEGVTRVTSLRVSSEVFGILGIDPLAGRLLSNDPDAREVVLTDAFWARAFGRDPGVFGSERMTLGGEPHVVVGAVALPVGYPGSGDVVTRLAYGEADLVEGMRGARYVDVIARVRTDHSLAEASSEMDRVVAGLGEILGNHAGWGGEASMLSDELLAPYRSVLALLVAAGALFLLLAVVNVVGLVAARSIERRGERSVRLALGASEARLLRGSAVESAVLGGLAAVGALVAAHFILGPIRALIPAEVPRAEAVGLDPLLVAAIVAVALVAGVFVGAAGHALSSGGAASLRRTTPPARRGALARGALVSGQIALTTVLGATGAAVLAEMMRLQSVDLGFQPTGVVSAQVMLVNERYPDPDARLVFWRALLERMEASGLDVAVGTSPPMAGVNMPWGYRRDASADQAFAQYHIVSPDYFSVMGVEVVEGRGFTPDDRAGGEPVVVVNEALARSNYPDGPAVGRTLEVVGRTKTIVGVARSVRHAGPSEDVPEEIYAPFTQDPWPHAQILVRGDLETAAALVPDAADSVDPRLGLPPMAPYDRFVAEWFAALRLQLAIVGVLATVGTLLAALGLYALVAFQVNAGRREIGIRRALGASDVRVFGDVVRRGVSLALVGLGVGLAGWYAALPAARGLLGGVDPSDPWVPVVVAVGVGGVSLLASIVPARRSVSVDPVVTLTSE